MRSRSQSTRRTSLRKLLRSQDHTLPKRLLRTTFKNQFIGPTLSLEKSQLRTLLKELSLSISQTTLIDQLRSKLFNTLINGSTKKLLLTMLSKNQYMLTTSSESQSTEIISLKTDMMSPEKLKSHSRLSELRSLKDQSRESSKSQ